MRRGLRPAPVAAAALIAGAVASCTSIIGGLGDENRDIVSFYCHCGPPLGDLHDELGVAEACEPYLERRFELATQDQLDAWLTAFDAQCRTCDRAEACFYMEPLCKRSREGCTAAWECCSSRTGGGCDAGVCD